MKFCPHCGNNISQYLAAEGISAAAATVATPPVTQGSIGKYDQTATWKKIIAQAESLRSTPPSCIQLAETAALAVRNSCQAFGSSALQTIVHIAFDREIVPKGGTLYQAALLEGRTSLDVGRLSAMGYVVEDGKVAMVNDAPIGKAYSVIDYWGGTRQHKRWHLAEPVKLSAARNDSPFFMDETMVAFGAKWLDTERIAEALLELLDAFTNGVKGGGCVAHPLVLEIVPASD